MRSGIITRRHAMLAAAAAAALIAGAGALGHGDDPIVNATPTSSATGADIAELLTRVSVVDHLSNVPGYERSCGKGQGCVFGPAWNDPLDRSGCDTRNRLLANTLRDVTFKPGTRQCKVIGGVLDPDPYTGQRITFSSNAISIDHIYPLARAYAAGAATWEPRQRQVFANDLTELAAVSAAANRAKSDSGIDEWLPPFQPCTLIQRYLTVAVKYQLPITVAEQRTATATCPTTAPSPAS